MTLNNYLQTELFRTIFSNNGSSMFQYEVSFSNQMVAKVFVCVYMCVCVRWCVCVCVCVCVYVCVFHLKGFF